MTEVRIRPKREGRSPKNVAVESRLYEQTAGDTDFGEFSGPHVPMWTRHPSNVDDEEKQPKDIGDTRTSTVSLGLKGDYGNIALLLFLYLLQGIPLGLTSSIPLVLQSRQISYAQQAIFSFAYWPFSLKLLWAPIVDSFFSKKVGRRKSWLVPTQYLIGIFMLVLSLYVSDIIGSTQSSESKNSAGPNVLFLTSIFFAFNFLAATQDIAVDGWALTMLSQRNVGYASTCNAAGQTAGFFIGNVVFLALESTEFCNNYIRSIPQPRGITTLAEFVYIWGWIYLITTTLLLLLKKEDPTSHTEHHEITEDMGIVGTYRLLWDIIRLKPVVQLVFIYLTCKVCFAAADGISGLKLIELGVPKDKLAFIAVPLVPLQVVLPWVIGSYTAGPYPLRVYTKAYPYRIIMGLVFAGIVWWTPQWKSSDGHYPFAYYTILTVAYMFHQVTVYCGYVATMAFTAKVSDPIVGGTYMTLLNTVANLGGNWPVTLALSIVDDLTWRSCASSDGNETGISCVDDKDCVGMSGKCATSTDGYYILTAVCTVFGIVWLYMMRRRIERLHHVPKADWSCIKGNRRLGT